MKTGLEILSDNNQALLGEVKVKNRNSTCTTIDVLTNPTSQFINRISVFYSTT